MNEVVEILNFFFALGGIVLMLSSVYLLFDLKKEQLLKPYISQYGLTFAFLLTLFSSAMTLVYSEIFLFVPCGLCWLQRVFLYPMVFLTGTAIWFKDKTVAVYGIVLAIPGILVGLYQHYLQMGGSELVGCPAAGEGANCAERILFEFDFITFPLLSAITFTFLIVLYLYVYKTR